MNHLLSERIEILEVNAEARTMKQRIIRAGRSKNKRHYPKKVLMKAAALFENAPAFPGHMTKQQIKDNAERPPNTLAGWLSNVQYDESENALVATRHFAPTAMGRDMFALAQEVHAGRLDSSVFGASIHALGSGQTNEDGEVVVESIDQVLSVDDVLHPAAGGGFIPLTASEGGFLSTITADLSRADYEALRPDIIEQIRNDFKNVRRDDEIRQLEASAETYTTERDNFAAALREAEAKAESTAAEHASAIRILKEEHGEAIAALTEDVMDARRELAVYRALESSLLPAQQREALKTALLEAEEAQWEGLIASFKLAWQNAATNGNPGIAESQAQRPAPILHDDAGAGRGKPQVNLPRPGENVKDWMERTNRTNSVTREIGHGVTVHR